jgi:hypothetical protein
VSEVEEVEKRCARQRRSAFVTGVITGMFLTALTYVLAVFA